MLNRSSLVLWVLLIGCSTTPRDAYTGERPAARHSERSRPVELSSAECLVALKQLAQGVTPPTHPEQAARQLFHIEPRSGNFFFDAKHHRLSHLSPGEQFAVRLSSEQEQIVQDYLRWCERTGRPGDCLRLLLDRPYPSEEARVTLALALAKGVVWQETLEAFKGMADPQAFEAALLWTISTYLLLWALPEPASKGLAGAMTVALIGYVGLDTLGRLIAGFLVLKQEAERASTFHQLRESGERYGKVFAGNAARAFALLAMAALGRTAGEFSTRLPGLPGFAAAASQAQRQVGVSLSAAVQAEAVTVSNAAVSAAASAGAALAVPQGEPAANEDCTGQEHHVISRPIAKALDEHRTLKGLYEPRDPRFVATAKDKAAHNGYQHWHRDIDREVITWLEENKLATPQEFEAFLREIYSRAAMRMRFPNGF